MSLKCKISLRRKRSGRGEVGRRSGVFSMSIMDGTSNTHWISAMSRPPICRKSHQKKDQEKNECRYFQSKDRPFFNATIRQRYQPEDKSKSYEKKFIIYPHLSHLSPFIFSEILAPKHFPFEIRTNFHPN
jgi:hypothetical protein